MRQWITLYLTLVGWHVFCQTETDIALRRFYVEYLSMEQLIEKLPPKNSVIAIRSHSAWKKFGRKYKCCRHGFTYKNNQRKKVSIDFNRQMVVVVAINKFIGDFVPAEIYATSVKQQGKNRLVPLIKVGISYYSPFPCAMGDVQLGLNFYLVPKSHSKIILDEHYAHVDCEPPN